MFGLGLMLHRLIVVFIRIVQENICFCLNFHHTPCPPDKRSLWGTYFSPNISKFFKTPILTSGMDTLGEKHRKNCECCPVSLLIVRSQWLSWSQVLDCLKCKQFHTPCHVSVMVSVFVFSFVFVIGWVIVFWLVRSYIIITYVSKVTSLEDRSLNVFSKCICLCHCLCLCICLCHDPFCWSGHVS